MLLNCPWCGERDQIEFVCGGESHIARPGPAQSVSDAQWADYLFFRENRAGVSYERWMHRNGCAQWFNVARDARSHAIYAVYGMRDAKPDIVE